MMEAVQGSLHSSEVILVLTDVFSTVPFSEDDKILQKLKRTKQNVLVVVNKIDLLDKVTIFTAASDADDDGGDPLGTRTTSVPEAVAKWRSILPNAVAIIPISCKTGQNIQTLRKLFLAEPDVPAAFRSLGRPVPGTFRAGESTVTDEMARSLLPVSPPLYSFSTLTDRSERFFASEIIRTVLFGKFKKDVPYSCEVAVTGFTELEPGSKEKVRRLSASIMVERESQKGILVGKGGVMVKEVGVGSRKRLEEFFQERIHLDLSVKVDKDWRKEERKLKRYRRMITIFHNRPIKLYTMLPLPPTLRLAPLSGTFTPPDSDRCTHPTADQSVTAKNDHMNTTSSRAKTGVEDLGSGGQERP